MSNSRKKGLSEKLPDRLSEKLSNLTSGTGTNDTWMMDEGRRLMEDGRGMM